MITADNVGFNKRRMFIQARSMLGFGADGVTGLGAGTPVFAEIATALELGGMAMAADADEAYHFMPIPWDFDPNYPLRARVWFAHTTTDADEPVWSLAYKFMGKQDAISDAKSSPDGTLTFPALAVSTTDNSLEITSWQESTSQNQIATTDFALLFALTCTTISASANEILLLGVELDYTFWAPNRVQNTTLQAIATPSTPNG